MKNIAKALVFILLLFLLPLDVSAAGQEQIRPYLLLERKEEMKAAVHSFFSPSGSDSLPFASFDVNQAYVIGFNNEYLVETVRKNGSFSSLKGENAQVWIPTGSGHITLQWKDGKFTAQGYSVSATGQSKGFSWDKMTKLLQEAGILSPTDGKRAFLADTRIVRSNLYQAVFASVYADGQEYVVVFNSMLDEAGIEDEKLYTKDELLDKLEAFYDEEATRKAVRNCFLNGSAIAGGVLPRGTPVPQIDYVRLILIGGGIALVVFLLIRAGRRPKPDRKEDPPADESTAPKT